MAFTRAERRKSYLRLALTGPSGSGKTYSALLLAYGLTGDWEKVAILDTEQGSASLYAHLGSFATQELTPPFTVEKYLSAVQEAHRAGFECLIIDSISHEWAGDGGLLAQKEALDARGGNAFTHWSSITKQHEKFKSGLLQAPLHLIVTIRSKVEYVVDGEGKPRKVGMAPIQRDGMEYEFTTVLDVAINHTAQVSKDRTALFAERPAFRITPETGQELRQWLDTGAEPPPPDPLELARVRYARACEALGVDRTESGWARRQALIYRQAWKGRAMDSITAEEWDELSQELEDKAAPTDIKQPVLVEEVVRV